MVFLPLNSHCHEQERPCRLAGEGHPLGASGLSTLEILACCYCSAQGSLKKPLLFPLVVIPDTGA